MNRRMGRARYRGNTALIVAVCAVLVCIIVVCVVLFVQSVRGQSYVTRGDATAVVADEALMGDVYIYQGETYLRNTDITTVLFLGVDQSDADRTYTSSGGGRSDAIMLLLLDEANETITMLQLSRDTMVSVDFYGLQDEYVYSSEMQLSMQYSAGSSTARSNWLSTQKVSEVLYGTPIDYTMSLTMDGISVLVDALGGIEVTVPADYTDINPLFAEGETILLDGALAVAYVQYRDTDEFGSNNGRMARQAQVITQLSSQLSELVSDAFIEMMQTVAAPYMRNDFSDTVIEQLSSYTLLETIYTPEGENVAGTHDEFYLDEDALVELILDLFYQKASD